MTNNRFRYAETLEELERRLADHTATATDYEVARALNMGPWANHTAEKTSYKSQGNQSSLDRHVANVNRLSAQMDQIVADKQQRAQKAFQGHVGSGAASVRNPAEPTGANPPRNQAQPHSRAGKPEQKSKRVIIDGQDYTDQVNQMLGVKPTVQKLPGRGNPAAQRPPARKEYQDEYLNMADQMTGTWPGSNSWSKAWGKSK